LPPLKQLINTFLTINTIMKKLLLSLSIACLGLAAQAQDFKPAKGDVTTEFGLAGGILRSNFKLNDGLLRARYFVKSDLAIRAGFNLSTNNDTKNFYGAKGSAFENKTGYEKNNITDFTINLGVEKHFAGTERLSPYVGADFIIGNKSVNFSRENTDGNNYEDGDHLEVKGANPNNEFSSFNIGLRAVLGADYYIAKNLYLGAEAGFGFQSSKKGKITVNETVNGTASPEEVMKSSGKGLGINTNIITAVRVGFVF
jgi:opacity protein-like surface antigen